MKKHFVSAQAVRFPEEDRTFLLPVSQTQYVNNYYTILFRLVEGWLPEEQKEPRGVVKGISA